MELSTYEEWQIVERQRLQRHAEVYPDVKRDPEEHLRGIDEKRSAIRVLFPYSVVATGFYPEHDYAQWWCWQHVSPENGPCNALQSDCPACPLVLATKQITREIVTDKDGKTITRKHYKYHNPGAHEHEGKWQSLWLSKTGYDYGYNEYCFATESDQLAFLAAIPLFIWSEMQDKSEEILGPQEV